MLGELQAAAGGGGGGARPAGWPEGLSRRDSSEPAEATLGLDSSADGASGVRFTSPEPACCDGYSGEDEADMVSMRAEVGLGMDEKRCWLRWFGSRLECTWTPLARDASDPEGLGGYT